MKIIQSVLAGVLLLSTAYTHAQTADDVINKHIAAIGGKDVINKIKSQITESSISLMGSDLPSTSTLLVGKGFKNVSSYNGQEIVQCITPTSGWMINPLAGVLDPVPIPEEQLKEAQSALEVGGALFNYKEKGSKAELAGNEKIEGVNAIKIKLTSKDGKESFYFIDPATNYLIKHEAIMNVQGQDVSMVSTFSNYKKTDIGYVMPYTTIRNQGFEMTITTNKVEFNKDVDPKIFEMPK
jgi:hypothetical protein